MPDVTSVQGGSAIKLYREGSTAGTSPDVQYVRRHTATASTPAAWVLSTTASQCVAADEARVTLVFTNCGTGMVYLCPGGTTPTQTLYQVQLGPGETYVVEDGDVELAWNAVANTSAGGSLQCWRGTVPT